MADAVPENRSYQLVCPHCGKPFEAELLTGGSDRHTGFKCPNCRLFVAYKRANIEDSGEAT
jgi:DNA-directed RNA polymerase subunit RPC12/RpoP